MINKKFLVNKLIYFCPPLIFIIYLDKWCRQVFWEYYPGAPPNDFLGFWAASYLALAGMPSSVYNISMFQTVVTAVSGTNLHTIWFYPPTLLLIILPLSLLPLATSMYAWLFITALGYIQVIRRLAPNLKVTWLTLAFPATFLNLTYGQNGFLSATLLGGGMLLLQRHPILSGLLLGLYSYKPHLSFLIPFALAAGRYWKTLGAAFASFVVLVLISILVFGWETWAAFGKNIPIATKMLENGVDGLIQTQDKMISVFPCALVAGSSPSAALFLQGSIMVMVFVLIIWVWFREGPLSIKASALIIGTLLFTPHAYGYDLPLLAIPLAWLGWEGHVQGWLPGEQELLFIAWCSPTILFAPTKANIIIPLILLCLLGLAIRRMLFPWGSKSTVY